MNSYLIYVGGGVTLLSLLTLVYVFWDDKRKRDQYRQQKTAIEVEVPPADLKLVLSSGQVWDVEVLPDTVEKGLKLMLSANVVLAGRPATITLKSESKPSFNGLYRVTRLLAPAAPRGWRLYVVPRQDI